MKRITMSLLGNHGRFANQLFQYMFLHTYAVRHGLEVQTSPWIGENLFEIEPAPITDKLANYYEPLHKTGEPKGPPEKEAINCDFHGYGQFHTSWFKPGEGMIRRMFSVREEVMERLDPAIERFHKAGYTTVGIQLRRGDYGRLIHYITPVQWYLNWLQVIWPLLDDPVLFIASEDRSLVKEFAAYNPFTAESLGIDLKANPQPLYTYQRYDVNHPQPHLMDFFPDWYLLRECEYLAIPNSTFSFVPAMLSNYLVKCWRSHLPTQGFREIDPWNTTPMEYDLAEDHKDIPGVYLEKNEQY